MPILFAVSPLAAIRSAPVKIASTSPRAIIRPAAESAITVCGIPASSSSQAVRRAPWSNGRVSSTRTCSRSPCLPRRAQRADGRPVAAGGEPAGVAVRQRARPGEEQRRGVRRHRPAALDLLGVDLSRPLGGIAVPARHLRERPGEVDRGRARARRAPRMLRRGPPRARPRLRSRTPPRSRSPARRARRASGSPRRARASSGRRGRPPRRGGGAGRGGRPRRRPGG